MLVTVVKWGGKGYLTESLINSLSVYFGGAICNFPGDVDGMFRAIWAVFHHSISADEQHDHQFCPTGSDSWCKYNRALADNVEPPKHTPKLPKDLGPFIKPVFTALSKRDTFFQTHLLFDRLFSEPFILWPGFFRAIYFLTGFFQSQTFLLIHLRWPSTGLPHNLKKIKTMHTIQSKTLLHWGMMFNSQGKFHLHTSLQISSCFSILHVHTGTANSRKAWKYKNISRNNWNFIRTHFSSGDYTSNHKKIWTHICSCHNFFPLSFVQIFLIPACCLLCVL